ncbi:lipoprotein insertase outer membrane protein LolB [Marinobacterium weihaiense]|uniref:Outer-membrane lipoprotein LolB n=1 Tax=Marinobacterium weihaiense TaxID=2851016 RepID=A0ABS6M8E0_9GAMM|nr:lipoprotein insertase outer membrane protein LolB [Marinobacterium weihaiense]MBV0932556.1 lipoprotein insertase outer membrane protein LolB [Marinobacterium weihaiense]
MLRLLCMLALIIALSGCSQLRQQPEAPLVFDARQAQALQQWSAEGRIGIRWSQDSQSANLYWHQADAQYRIRLTGPLGQGGLRIDGTPNSVSLKRSGDNTVHHAATPEALMQELLGWHLPLTQARYWIRGLPAPDSRFEQLTEQPVRSFKQAGWHIEYPRLTRAAGRVLPAKLRLRRDDLRIIVIINEWATRTEL